MKKFVLFFALCAALFGAGDPRENPFFKDVNSTCPIKFIDVFTAPRFIAALEYNDGEKVLFSSPKQMFHYMYKRSSAEHVAPIRRMLVTDYASGELIDASEAFYVFGSRVVSASGDDLIPFSNLKSAEDFSREHSGHRILEFKDVKQKLIEYLE
jgi:nitrous oxide reductase accessory protein NosL